MLRTVFLALLLSGCSSRVPYLVMKDKASPPVVLCGKTARAEVDGLLGAGADTGSEKAAGFARFQYTFAAPEGDRSVVVRYENDAVDRVIPEVEWRRAEDVGASPVMGGRGEDGRPLWVEQRLSWLSACKFIGEHSASAEVKADAFQKLMEGARPIGANFFVVLPSDPHAYPPRYHAAYYQCGEVKPDACVSGPLVR